jgi:hypothetical protein
VTWESFESGNDTGNEIATRKISADEIASWNDTLSLKFPLPIHLVQSWINNVSDSTNHGILISASTPASFIIEFYSNNEPIFKEGRPMLTLYTIEDTTGQDDPQTVNSILTISPEKDCTIAKTNRGASSEFLHIANGTALRTLLFFNLDSIPDEATINRALLILHADTMQSFPNNHESFEILAHHATEIPWPIPLVPYDSTLDVSGIIPADSTWIQINASPLVQRWTFGTSENQGLLLKGAGETDDILERVFYSTCATDSLLRPYMEIYYTLPPNSRL